MNGRPRRALFYAVLGVLISCGSFTPSPVIAERDNRTFSPSSALEPAPWIRVSSLLEGDDLWTNRVALQENIRRNLAFLESADADLLYSRAASNPVSRELVAHTQTHLLAVLFESKTPAELYQRLDQEFVVYRSVGRDGQGTVRFTGYFQPVYRASPTPSPEFRFPVFRKPADFERWSLPHPRRVELEGQQGLGEEGTLLRGLELAWLRSRFEAFMIQVQGSAVLEFPNGQRLPIGFAAGTRYPFRGISKEFLRSRNLAWNKLDTYFAARPSDLDSIMTRNNRFVFFEERGVGGPLGSVGVPVTAERSIATDKSQFPAGGMALIRTNLPVKDHSGKTRLRYEGRVVFDQDTGSAIRGPGRVDLYMGTGNEGKEKANRVFSDGELYYLLLKS